MGLPEGEGEQRVELERVEQPDCDLDERCGDEQCDRGPLEEMTDRAHRGRLEQAGEDDVELGEDERDARDPRRDVNALAQLVDPERSGGEDHPRQGVLEEVAVEAGPEADEEGDSE